MSKALAARPGTEGFDGLFPRQHAANGKEASLHDGVDAAAHPGIARDFVSIDHEKLQTLLDDGFLRRSRQMVPNIFGTKRRVQQECAAGLRRRKNVHAFEKRELVAGDEIRLADQIRRANGMGAEPKMGHGARTRFLRVVNEIALRVIVGALPDNLDGILVGSHGAVRAETVEKRANGSGIFGGETRIIGKTGVSHVILNADGEMILWRRILEFIENGLGHRGSEFF
jgi:hypothetical protein